jgi:predicted ribosomally synthesized peptide with SipW-like signal peptide
MKTRLYLMTILALFAIMALGMSGTSAWFTDQKSIENLTISTGNLDLQINNVTQAAILFEPGDGYKEVLRFCAKNNGDYAMKWRAVIAPVQNDAGLQTILLFKAIINPPGLAGNYGPANTVRFSDIALSALLVPNAHFMLGPTSDEPFLSGKQICYSLQAKLQSSAGNILKGKVFKANLVFNATQWINPGWSE